MIYRDGQAALKFLTEGLGFTLVASYAGAAEGSIAHAELAWPAGGGVMISSVDRNAEPNEFDAFVDQKRRCIWCTTIPDALFPKAMAAGATVVREMREEDYGSRRFSVADPRATCGASARIAARSARRPQAAQQ